MEESAPAVQPPEIEKRPLTIREELSRPSQKWSSKITTIIIALIVLQIPIFMISGLNDERMTQSENAAASIARSWAGEQNIQQIALDNSTPDKLELTASFAPEIRYLGIYQSVIYTSESQISADFSATGKNILLKFSDLHGLVDLKASVNGKPATYTVSNENGIHCAVIKVPENTTAPVKLQCTLKLRGSKEFAVTPCARQNNITLKGNWGSPNFSCSEILPDSREIKPDSFTANWQINNLYDQDHLQNNCAKVNFHIAAGTYQQVERTITYATFFLVVFFLTLICGELISKTAIHPLQYIIAAGAPVLFYLMLLSVGEKTNFACGYLISATVIVLMVSGYARLFFGKNLPAILLGTVFAVSYVANYLLLQMEDFALLSGTIILAVFLGATMVLTGKLNQKTTDI